MVHGHKPKQTTGSWVYPSSKDVLKEAGLYKIQHYVQVHYNCITAYIVYRPILNVCRERGRKWGSRPRQFWWDQPMELNGAREAAGVKPDFRGGKTTLL